MPDIRDLPKARVTVVGDVIIDRWVYGRVERISPEAPVPVFVQERVEEMDGGAGNVFANLGALGCQATLCRWTDVGPVKTRYVGNGQQMFRVDEEKIEPISDFAANQIFLQATTSDADVLIISDYGKGVCTAELCQRLIGWAKTHGVKVVVDPKGVDWSKYCGCDVITPNESEWHASGQSCGDALLITRGARGMSLFREGQPVLDIPAVAREVFDVTGAGDTVVAVLATALAVGFDLPWAVRLANAAAGVVVGKRGTATCSLEELERTINPPPSPRNLVVGWANGVFDGMHAGHQHFLRECRKQCDVLYVGIDTDGRARELKGDGRPLVPFAKRFHALMMEPPVMDARWFASDAGLRALIEEIKPDIIFKGSDYEGKKVVGSDLARVVLIPRLPGYSTTELLAKRNAAKLDLNAWCDP